MPNCGGRTDRSQGPHCRNVSASRKALEASGPDSHRSMQINSEIGEQLLLTLVQTLPSCVMDAARSRTFSQSALPKRSRSNSCRPLKAPATTSYILQAGLPVRQVSGRDRTINKGVEQVTKFSVGAFLRRRRESSKAKAKARDEEYEKVPKVNKSKEIAMAQVKAREEEYEKIPRVKGGTRPTDTPALASSEEASLHSIQDTSQNRSKKPQKNTKELSHTNQDIPQSSPKRSPKSSQEASHHSIQNIPQGSPKKTQKSNRESSNDSIQEEIGSPKTSEKVRPRTSEKGRRSSQGSPKSQNSPRSQSSPRSPSGSYEISIHPQDILKNSSHKSTKKNSRDISAENSLQGMSQIRIIEISNLANKSGQKGSIKGSQEEFPEGIEQKSIGSDISLKSSQQSISQKGSNEMSNKSSQGSLEEEPKASSAPTESKNPIMEQSMQTDEKVFPCFRGEYPTRRCKDSYMWFQPGVPNCGKFVAICNREQQVLHPAEIVTACEVTESHFLAVDENNGNDPPTCDPCNKCRQVMYGYPVQQQQQQPQQQQQQHMQQQQQHQMQQQQHPQMQQHQQQDMNWVGSYRQQQYPCRQPQVPCRPQQQVPCRQQQLPCRQQQAPYMQQQLPSMQYSPSRLNHQQSHLQQQSSLGQQQSSCGQHQSPFGPPPRTCMKRSTCRQNPPHKVCWKCPSRQQFPQQLHMQTTPQPQQQQAQPAIQGNNCGLNEMLAEELKQQMQEAQAQIAKVQLQLNSACGCAPSNCPGYAPNRCAQFMNNMAMEQNASENNNREGHEEPSEQPQEQKSHGSNQSRVDSGQQPVQFGFRPVPVSLPNQSSCYQEQAMPLHMPMTFSCQQLPPCQQQVPPCQRNVPPCQQEYPSQQQMPPCQQQQHPSQQQPRPSQQPCYKPPCQQPCYKPPSQQQQPPYPCQPNQLPSSSQQNMFPYSSRCPSWYLPRFAQMRFMMPRCWPR